MSFLSNGIAHNTGTMSGSFLLDCKRSDNASVNMEMDSGGSITLVLKGDIINNKVSPAEGSALTVSLKNFSDVSLSPYAPTVTTSHVQWSDSFSDASPVFFRWIENPETEI